MQGLHEGRRTLNQSTRRPCWLARLRRSFFPIGLNGSPPLPFAPPKASTHTAINWPVAENRNESGTDGEVENRKSETVYNHRKNLSTLRSPVPPGTMLGPGINYFGNEAWRYVRRRGARKVCGSTVDALFVASI